MRMHIVLFECTLIAKLTARALPVVVDVLRLFLSEKECDILNHLVHFLAFSYRGCSET